MNTVIMWVLVVSHAGVTAFSPVVDDQYSCDQMRRAVRGNAEATCVQIRVPSTK